MTESITLKKVFEDLICITHLKSVHQAVCIFFRGSSKFFNSEQFYMSFLAHLNEVAASTNRTCYISCLNCRRVKVILSNEV